VGVNIAMFLNWPSVPRIGKVTALSVPGAVKKLSYIRWCLAESISEKLVPAEDVLRFGIRGGNPFLAAIGRRASAFVGIVEIANAAHKINDIDFMTMYFIYYIVKAKPKVALLC
jgi:hypothetical protein